MKKNNEEVEGWVKGKQRNYKKIYNTHKSDKKAPRHPKTSSSFG